jgi:hypothetical protein
MRISHKQLLMVGAVGAVGLACSPGPAGGQCTTGASVACTCTDGRAGAQLCHADGTLGDCVCSVLAGTGGSNGSGGAGGNRGSGGANLGNPGTGGANPGTGGSNSGEMGASGMFTVVYSGGPTKNLTTCYFCKAYYFPTPPPAFASLAYGFTGNTSVDVELRPAATGGGYEVGVFIAERDTALLARFQGDYGPPKEWAPLNGSCVTLTQIDLRNGGSVAGSLNCTVSGGSDTTPITATVQGSFQGAFPP